MKSVIERFTAIKNIYSDRIAIRYREELYTYEEVDKISNRITCNLLDLGLCVNSKVGIYMERNAISILILLAITKLDCIYVPLSCSNPIERTKYMIGLSDVNYLIVDRHIDNIEGVSILNYESLLTENMEEWLVKEKLEDLLLEKIKAKESKQEGLYTIFTSGSTGEPKAFHIGHEGILNLADSMSKRNWNKEHDTYKNIGELAELSFDVSQGQIYLAFLSGRTLDIIPTDIKKQPRLLYHYLNEHQIHHCDITPTLLEFYMQYIESENLICTYPYSWATSGEQLSIDLAKRVIKNNENCSMVNSYGPSETCVYVSLFVVDKDNIDKYQYIPIGQAIDGVELVILDERMEVCPVGVEGEIGVYGIGLTKGYLKREDLTKKVFIENTDNTGRVLYKTGDYGVSDQNGIITYGGRRDGQVKFHGVRIELQEIEHRMNQMEEIVQCKVLVKEKGKDLVAYYVSKKQVSYEELVAYLEQWLAPNMIPNYFVPIKEFTSNVNGKMDLSMLLDYKRYGLRPSKSDKSDRTSNLFYDRFLSLARHILDDDRIELDDNFFCVGGDSLSLLHFIMGIETNFEINSSTEVLWKCRTLKDMADYVAHEVNISKKKDRMEPLYRVNLNAIHKDIILAEKRSRNDKDGYPSHNIIHLLECDHDLDYRRLEDAMRKVVLQQDALRSSIEYEENDYYLQLHQQIDMAKLFQYIKLEQNLTNEVIRSYVHSFELHEHHLINLILLEGSHGEQKIILNAHHVIFDYFSVTILIQGLFRAYFGDELPSLPMSYYHTLENNRIWNKKNDKLFWKAYYSGRKKAALFPTKARTDIRVLENDSFDNSLIILKGIDYGAIIECCNQNNITAYQFFLAVWGKSLQILSGMNDVILGTFVPGRPMDDINYYNVIGMYTNCLGIRLNDEGYKNRSDYLKYVKDQHLAVMEYQNTQLREVFQYLDMKDLIKGELFQVIINYHSMIRVKVSNHAHSQSIRVNSIDIGKEANTHPFTITIYEEKERFKINIKTINRLYSEDSIGKIYKIFRNVMTEYTALDELIEGIPISL